MYLKKNTNMKDTKCAQRTYSLWVIIIKSISYFLHKYLFLMNKKFKYFNF